MKLTFFLASSLFFFISCKNDEVTQKLESDNKNTTAAINPKKSESNSINCRELFEKYGKCFVPNTEDIYNVPVGNSPVKGSEKALVTIVEFTDFQCPYCAKMAKKLMEMEQKYSGNVRVVFKNYPLSYHKEALLASKVAIILKKRLGTSAFWKFHDQIFANQANLNKDFILKTATKQGISTENLKKALDSGKGDKTVKKDINLGKKVKVEGTPWIFINGIKLEDQGLEQLIKKEIAHAQIFSKSGTPRSKIYNYLTNHNQVVFKRKLDEDDVKSRITQFKTNFLEHCQKNSKLLNNHNYYYILHNCGKNNNQCQPFLKCVKNNVSK